MKRFQSHTLVAGATAIALVMAPPAYAQQSEGQSEDAQVQQQAGLQDMQGAEVRTRIGDRLEAARTALDEENADEARRALDEAADELSTALEGQDQPSEGWQRLDERLTEAREALDGDDMQAVRDALDEAETALAEAAEDEQTASAEEGTDQTAAATTTDTDAEPQAGAVGRQPIPALDAVEAEVGQQAAAEGEQQQTGAGVDQQAAAEIEEAAAAEGRQPIPQDTDAGAEGQRQAEGQQQAETQQQATAGAGQQQQGAEGEAAEIEVVEGEQPPAEGDVEVEEVEAEVTDVTVVEGDAAEPAAGTEATAEGEQDAEFAAEVVRGDELSVEETNELLSAGDIPVGEPAEMLSVAPGDLEGRDVVTFEGDSIGEVEQVVLSEGEVHAIVAHGGFLGIGRDRVAVPVSRLGMRGEEVVLLGLSEEQLDAMPEFDFETGQVVPEGQMLDMGRYE